MPTLLFVPFQASIVDGFWKRLNQRKIDQDRLKDDDVPVMALYSSTSFATGSAHCRLNILGDSFDVTSTSNGDSCIARGVVHNTNTLEDFKRKDKTQWLHKIASRTWEDILSGAAMEEPSLLVAFSLLCFADLKRYTYTYWMNYPAFTKRWIYDRHTPLESEQESNIKAAFEIWRESADAAQKGFFVYDTLNKKVSNLALWSQVEEQHRLFAFVDPSGTREALGWPARNLLYALSISTGMKSVDILCWSTRNMTLYHQCDLQGIKRGMPKPLGWEHDGSGKLQPRFINLARSMDPQHIASEAVNLNLKLMKWRIAPMLDLNSIKRSRCLLLGAGTLGCYVARQLMSWGVENITLIDSGRVSFSNPVRQPLFKFADCLDQGQAKAETAANALKEIYPGINARGLHFTIPMIGHPYDAGDEGREEFQRLEEEIANHDTVFLLMDSRESRWLPTVIAKAQGKLVINAALGFDSYVVLRHGSRPSDAENSSALGCYFCNDVVAPADSTSDRTLDQQCTVTRPGLAAIASATAVELFASVCQHPAGIDCPATSTGDETVLGSVPHTVRGSLRSWNTKVLCGEAYPFCSACSPTILEHYNTDKWQFVQRAVNEIGWIESLSGLKAVQAGIEGIDVDWDSESDE